MEIRRKMMLNNAELQEERSHFLTRYWIRLIIGFLMNFLIGFIIGYNHIYNSLLISLSGDYSKYNNLLYNLINKYHYCLRFGYVTKKKGKYLFLWLNNNEIQDN